MLRIEFSAAARTEFRLAVRYYETRQRGLGTRFRDAVMATVSMLATNPDAGGSVPDVPGEMRRFLVSGFPFLVVYQHSGKRIRVVAVAHTRRAPNYWDKK